MVEALVGKWRGAGTIINHAISYGEILTISPFRTPKGQCFEWTSRTWKDPGSLEESPMHTEIGMFRAIPAEGKFNIELMLSHPFGMNEVETGVLEDSELELRSTGFSRVPTSTNQNVTGIRRLLRVNAETLSYQMFLTLTDREEYLHLEANLSKVIS